MGAISEKYTASIYTEDGGAEFLRNVGTLNRLVMSWSEIHNINL
jgi:hypothetical protein